MFPVENGEMEMDGPGQETPIPNVVRGKGPCITWTAEFVTFPVALAVGPAMLVLDGDSAKAGDTNNKDNNKETRFIV